MVTTIFGGLDRSHNREDQRGEPKNDKDWNADYDKHQRNAANSINEERKVEVEGLSGIVSDIVRIAFHREIDDQREDEADAEESGEMTQNAPDSIISSRCIRLWVEVNCERHGGSF
jgi:hypothetical protein